jgi:replicative DNA helicase
MDHESDEPEAHNPKAHNTGNVLTFPVRLAVPISDEKRLKEDKLRDVASSAKMLLDTTPTVLSGWLQPRLALEDEQRTLGAMMKDRANIPRVLQFVSHGDFYDERHRTIFGLILNLYERDEDVNQATVHYELYRDDKTGYVEGANYLRLLAESLAEREHPSSIKYSARYVKEASVYRQLQSAAVTLLQDIQNPELDLSLVRMVAESNILNLPTIRGGSESSQELVRHVQHFCRELNECYADSTSSRVPETPTGIDALDDILGGLRSNTLTILAAPSGAGKTDLSLNILNHIASRMDAESESPYYSPSVFFSSEVDDSTIVRRMVGMQGGISPRHFYDRTLGQEGWAKVNEAVNRIAKFDIRIYATEFHVHNLSRIRATVADLETMCGGLSCVVVDGIPPTTHQEDLAPAETLRALKVIARECRVPVLVTLRLSSAPVSRSVNKSTDLRKRLAEWGAVEDEADTVIFLSRPDDARRNRVHSGASQSSHTSSEWVELWVAKHRNGSVGTARVGYTPGTGKFFKPK